MLEHARTEQRMQHFKARQALREAAEFLSISIDLAIPNTALCPYADNATKDRKPQEGREGIIA